MEVSQMEVPEPNSEEDGDSEAERLLRNRMMDELLRTTHFEIGPMPTREEMNERREYRPDQG